ncbi:MAG: sensor histidine kinase [Byssovorax sp.]
MSVQRKGALAELWVRDGGVGIPKEAQSRIFNRFERAVSTRSFGGFGLGLYIARRIVEAHRGTIRVNSAPGRGATFTVELPSAGPPGLA